jgi:hypothetical protein
LNDIKYIFSHLKGTIDLGLFYFQKSGSDLVRYAHICYLSNPYKAKSQKGYVFTRGGTIISWRSVKQTSTETFLNHSKIIAIHEAAENVYG